MEKNIKITIFSLIVVISAICIIAVYNNNTSRKTFKKDGILYALTVDGTSATSFPSKGMYKVTVSCKNADCKWLYEDWKLSIENITGDVSCDIDFITIEKTYLNNYITSLAGTTQGTGEVVNENGYRYEGKNPNNYIWFNNEYWRIIGVFDSNTHGQSGENLVKIIRAEILDGVAWYYTSNTNDWTAASLNSLLNRNYYNATDGTSSGRSCAMIYGNINCDYTKRGIQAGYRSMIANVTWYLGGYSDSDATAEAFYGYERGATVYSERPTSTTGYIGLMYPSDYGYSVLSSSCARTTNLGSYSSSSCAGASWLFGNGYEGMLSPDSSNSYYVFMLESRGYLDRGSTGLIYGVRPVLYLDSSIYKIDGDGSLENPYIIGM